VLLGSLRGKLRYEVGLVALHYAAQFVIDGFDGVESFYFSAERVELLGPEQPTLEELHWHHSLRRCASRIDGCDPGRTLFVCGDQSGRTSVPIRPQRVQTILGHNTRITVSSGSQSALISAEWLHHGDSQ
jgi:hypothetical protein